MIVNTYELAISRRGEPAGRIRVRAKDSTDAVRTAEREARRDGLGKIEVTEIKLLEEVSYTYGAPKSSVIEWLP